MDTMETIESLIRWIGGLAALVVIIIVLISVRRFRSRPAGKTVGSSPARLYSPAFLVIASLISIGICVLLWRPIPVTLPPWAQVTALGLGALLYFSGIALLLWGRQALGKFHNVSSSQGVQLFADHELITNGPFAYVRHPMYLGTALMYLATPVALGSWWALLPALLIVPILVLRILNEEKVLAEQLPGYREYTQKIRYRLIPGVW